MHPRPRNWHGRAAEPPVYRGAHVRVRDVADGTQIAYDRYDPPEGAAAGVPPVIFVAAAMQFRAFAPGTGELAAAVAARGVSVLVYDRRGRGESRRRARSP